MNTRKKYDKEIAMERFLSVSEAAKLRNVTRQAMYLAIKLKKLKAYRHGDKWKVSKSDLHEYDANLHSRELHSAKPIFDEANGLISVEKAAKMINVPKQKLYYAIRTNKLKAERKKTAYIVNVSDLIDYQSISLPQKYTKKRA